MTTDDPEGFAQFEAEAATAYARVVGPYLTPGERLDYLRGLAVGWRAEVARTAAAPYADLPPMHPANYADLIADLYEGTPMAVFTPPDPEARYPRVDVTYGAGRPQGPEAPQRRRIRLPHPYAYRPGYRARNTSSRFPLWLQDLGVGKVRWETDPGVCVWVGPFEVGVMFR